MRLRTRILIWIMFLLIGTMLITGLILVRSSSILAILGIIALVLVGGVLAALGLSRQITAPLQKLIDATEAVGDGDYKTSMLVEVSTRPDELGRLSQTFDEMTREISARNRRLKLLLRVIPVGVALSLENDFNRLLEAIVIESQSITNADGGTLYMLQDQELKFVIIRNNSLNLAMGGTTGKRITFSPLPMFTKETGVPNHCNVATHAAWGHEWVNVADAYQADGFDFSGTRKFDETTGYRSQSFLTIPLEGDDRQVIGVLQLINAKDPETSAVIPFVADEVFETLVLLASTALTGYSRQEKLRREIEKLTFAIDHGKKSRQVSEITETDYFRTLLKKVRALRAKKNDQTD